MENYFANLFENIYYERSLILLLSLTKLVDHENGELREDWLKMRRLIVPALIENDEELDDDDRYFCYRTQSENKDEDKYKYKLLIFKQTFSE